MSIQFCNVPSIVIGLVGETGGGKDDFCNYLKRNYKDVFCYRFSDPLAEILRVLFNEIKKEDEQWLAVILREKFGGDILDKAIKKKLKNIKKGIICINGIRFWEDYQMVRDLGGKVVYITAKPKVRWQRIKKRNEKEDDSVSFRKFLKIEKAKTEVLILAIGKKADFKIENNDSRKRFYKEIRNIAKKLLWSLRINPAL